jgi:hypothetical protein
VLFALSKGYFLLPDDPFANVLAAAPLSAELSVRGFTFLSPFSCISVADAYSPGKIANIIKI